LYLYCKFCVECGHIFPNLKFSVYIPIHHVGSAILNFKFFSFDLTELRSAIHLTKSSHESMCVMEGENRCDARAWNRITASHWQ